MFQIDQYQSMPFKKKKTLNLMLVILEKIHPIDNL